VSRTSAHAVVAHSGGPTVVTSASLLGLLPTLRVTPAREADVVDADHVWSIEVIVGLPEAT
jgi:hypothetical protein